MSPAGTPLKSFEKYDTKHQKGFDEVIDAMPELPRRFPNLKYTIVGDGDDRGRLEEKVKSLGLSEQIIAGKSGT
jgi:phosphatidyl-myo-inositol dimannoside synthase